MEKVRVFFKDSSAAVEFVKKINSLSYNVDLYDGRLVFDAKSLMAIMALDFRKTFLVEAIIDESEYEKFISILDNFKV